LIFPKLTLKKGFSMKKILCFFTLIAGLSLHGISAHAHESSSSGDETEALVAAFPPVDAGVGAYSVTYSHDGKSAAVPNQTDGTVSVFRVHSRSRAFELIQTIPGGINPQFVVYSPDDRYAYLTNFGNFGGPDGSINVFHINHRTGIWSLIQTIDDPEVSSPYGIAISPSGKFLAVGNFSNAQPGTGFISMYHISHSTGILELISDTAHEAPEILTFSPDGKFLAVTNYTFANVSVFSVNHDGNIDEISCEGSPFPVGRAPEGIAYQHDGKGVAIANAGDGTVTFYQVDRETGKFYNPLTRATGDSSPAQVAISNDDKLLVVGSFNFPGAATVFCLKNKRVIQSIPNFLGAYSFAFDPLKDFGAFSIYGDGTNPGTVQVYQVNTSACSRPCVN
jgi:6-phosphogluconolactonase (cycloisomerase 2 family)